MEVEPTDTTVTPLTDECADCLEEVKDLAPASSVRKINPIVYLGLGVALVAMGQEFIEDGLRAIQANGGKLPGGRVRVLPVPVAHARLDH